MKTTYSRDWARTHGCGELRAQHEGREVTLCGWVKRRRDLGGLIFFDLRDRSGFVQVVCDPQLSPRAASAAKELRSQFVVGASGSVRRRSGDNVNPEMDTGEVEVAASRLAVFNESATPPFEPEDDTTAGEELRLQHRYIDLRRPRLQANLMLRHVATLAARNFFSDEGFIDVETPMLTRSTPEGARDYLVPSRLSRGRFYALPQSPQLFKQLLMISGYDRYMQIAKCFRDEDLRANRQPEFTQIDVEMAFVEPDDIFEVIERLMAGLFKLVGSEITLPFPVMPWREAMERYGSDKPDLRFGLELLDLSQKVAKSGFGVFEDTLAGGGVVKGIAVPGGSNMSRKQMERCGEVAKAHGAGGLVWIKWGKDGFSGPGAKSLGESLCEELLRDGGCLPGSALLAVAGPWLTACRALGALRLHLAGQMEAVDAEELKFLWIVDFPLFEEDDSGRPAPMHHPFTAPHPEDLGLLATDPLRVRSRAYDLVINGEEIGGGSIRIIDSEVQQAVFDALGIRPDEARAKFGFLLDALSFGAPPHGGIALGWDRLVAMLVREEAIRNVIAFPKTTSAVCLMTKAPAEVRRQQLRELGIKIDTDE